MFWDTKTPPRASMIKALAVAQPNSYNNRHFHVLPNLFHQYYNIFSRGKGERNRVSY